MLLCVIVAAVTDKLVNGVVDPIAPVNVVVPVPPAMVTACAPSVVLLKVIFALFEVMVLVPVNKTGLENANGLAPETVMLLPIWIWLALVKARLASGVVPPTAPAKITFPEDPELSVRAPPPLSVLVKLMFAPEAEFPPLVVSKVGLPVTIAGPVIVIVAPLVVMLPPTLIAVDPV